MKRLATLALTLLVAPALWAAPRIITLKVPGMTCPTCPITVKKALQRVEGVSNISVDLARKEVVVTFDDAKTNDSALVKATTDAGYPSKPVTTAK